MFFQDCSHIFRLILPDLRFECVLSFCMVFALGAIFTPLFILMGLQEGIIHNMIEPLKRNPTSRLVTPKGPLNRPLDEKWLEELEKYAQLVIPSSKAFLYLDIKGINDRMIALPTVSEDPLLIEHRISLSHNAPSAVLSFKLAERLEKEPGDTFTVVLIRNAIGKREQVPQEFRVAGVLPASVTPDVKFWIPLELFEQYNQWKKGYAVPGLGLNTGRSFLSPAYDGVLTLLKTVPDNETYRRMMKGKMGFSEPPVYFNQTGWRAPPDQNIRLWRPINSAVYDADIRNLINRHYEQGNFGLSTVPFFDHFKVQLSSAGQSIPLIVTILPKAIDNTQGNAPAGRIPVLISGSDNLVSAGQGHIAFYSGSKNKHIHIPVQIIFSENVTPGYIALPKTLAGKMNAARLQAADYDPVSGNFIHIEKEMRFFRAYAPTIDDLDPLIEFTIREGKRMGTEALKMPISNIEQVRIIRKLAAYMEKIYTLIVFVSGPSAFFAIFASVYAGVQRKRYDLAYLELLGVHPGAVFLFPFLKSLALITGGIILALALYLAFGYTINQWFAQALGDAASLTRLTGKNILILASGILGAGAFASLLAATSVIRIEPGEYIRE